MDRDGTLGVARSSRPRSPALADEMAVRPSVPQQSRNRSSALGFDSPRMPIVMSNPASHLPVDYPSGPETTGRPACQTPATRGTPGR